jgi:ABC-type lipoprotein release transport system permease subunit
MLWKLAWRNIWRNKRRSLIVLISVVVGLMAIVLADGLSNGMMRQMLFNQINLDISHIQIHKAGFGNNNIVKNYIPDYKHVESILQANHEVLSYSKRVLANGILSSANNSTGVIIYGVDPAEEAKVSIIKSSVIEGKYLGGGNRDIIIGKKLADNLGVEVGDKVVAMTNTLKGEIGSDAFKITGIFQTSSSDFDQMTVYIRAATGQELLGIGDNYYEFAIILKDYNKADQVKKKFEAELGSEYEVYSYSDLLPMLIYQMALYKESMMILNVIIGLALIFGIINAMLMSVFERISEFGVLMAIGMKNNRLFMMILLEALILGIIGTFAGLLCGLLLDIPLIHTGINLSRFAAGLESFGVGAIIYPVLSIGNILNAVIFMPFVAVAGAIYPAYKAVKLEPIYAINYL